MKCQFTVTIDNEPQTVTLELLPGSVYRVQVGEETLRLDAQWVAPGLYHLLHDGQGHDVYVEMKNPQMIIHRNSRAVSVEILDERQAARLAATGLGTRRSSDGVMAIRAPMPGKVVKALVKQGGPVSVGQGVIVIEAMKMENELCSSVDGLVKEIRVNEGDSVEAGETLVIIE